MSRKVTMSVMKFCKNGLLLKYVLSIKSLHLQFFYHRTIEHSYQSNNQEDNDMEQLLLGSEASEYTIFEDQGNSFFGPPTESSLPQSSTNPKIHSKIKCPGCMNDADVDSEFTRAANDQGT